MGQVANAPRIAVIAVGLALALTHGASVRRAGATEAGLPAGTVAPTVLCEGDCDGGDAVSVSELVALVNIALGKADASACMSGVPSDTRVDIALLVRAVGHALATCPHIVQIAQGVLRGDRDGGSRRFLDVPYAAAPVGELRWRPPQPAQSWSGTRPAIQFGPSCSRFSGGAEQFSEDCLHLNVWTPYPLPEDPRPVMVWFHGGGNQDFVSASATFSDFTSPQFNGRTLAETRGAVVVTVNYRLGVLGFLHHPTLAAEDPAYPYAGNQGLLDQRAALQWVRDNIAAFGGDPANVTIFGNSSGSFDVCLHLVSPGSAGLFQRAISQSNGCTESQATIAEAAPLVEQLADAANCGQAADVLACLRALPAEELLNANPRFFSWGSDNLIVDGGFLPDQPRALFDAGTFSKVPYLLGANAEEANGQLGELAQLLEDEGGYLGALRSRFGDRAEQVAAVYPPQAFEATADRSSELQALARAIGDYENVCPVYDTARRAAAGGADVYLYNFARPDADPEYAHLGADHLAEIGYVFGSIELPDKVDRDVASAIQGYWTRFADTGDPNGEGAVVWPRYMAQLDERISFEAPIAVLSGFRRAECELWADLYAEAFE